MKRRVWASLVLAGAVNAAPPKAIPVKKPEETAEVPKAVPVNSTPETPKKTPPESVDAPEAPPAGFRNEGAPLPQTNGTLSPSIPKEAPVRLPTAATTSPEDIQFDLAEALYGQKQWDAATTEYQRFVDQFPNSAKVGSAYFRMAEAHLKLGNTNSAKLFYSKQLNSPQPGPYTGIAAYKLADIEYHETDYLAASDHFKKAIQNLDQPAVVQSAKYFLARSFQFLGKKGDARGAFQPLADAPEDHPFKEASQFQLALLLEDAEKNAEALPRFVELSEKAKNAAVRAESATRAALIQLKLNDAKKALPMMEAALALPGTEQWHPLLRLGILRTQAALGMQQKFIDSFKASEESLDAAQLPEMLGLVGAAHRELKQYREALAVYDRLQALAPDAPAAKASRFDRLRCLYYLEKPELIQEIDTFLGGNPAAADRDNAALMKAEVLRVRKDYANASDAYARAVKSKELKPQRRIEALLRWSECAVLSANSAQTIEATTQFLAAAAEHAYAPTTLSWRAEANRRIKNLPAAEKDYRLIVDKYPKAEERHSSLLQLALIRGEQGDNKGMGELFEKLLKEYPESAEKAQANHWIGWASFESRDFQKAVTFLTEARKLAPDKYFESDSLRLIYCAFNLNDPDGVLERIREYLPKAKTKVPQDILRWASQQFLEAKKYAPAESVLALVCAGDEVKETDWLGLANTRLKLDQFEAAEGAADAYLRMVSQPSEKAGGRLIKARAELGKGHADLAQKEVEEALRLQPEGRINAEARLVAGDIKALLKDWEEAAKLYAAVAVVVDDDELSPVALEKAYRSYKQAAKAKEAADMLNRLQSRFPEYAREHVK